MNAALVDTNVLVYAHDAGAPAKQRRAVGLVRELAETRDGALCSQVLGEYVSVVSRKLKHALTVETACDQIRVLVPSFSVYDTTLDVVLEAGRGIQLHGFSYYDAQIWAVAKINRIPLVYSEDFTHGREVEGVRFENPFIELDERDPCPCEPES